MSKKVLIIDDDETNCFVFGKILEKMGYDPTLTYSGISALRKIGSNAYDLILIDIRMPIMNGYECSKQITEKLKEKTPAIIAITASSPKDCRYINTFINKPCSRSDIQNAINDSS